MTLPDVTGPILGLQVGSRSPWFLAVLAVHVSAALVAVAAGAGAAISRKGSDVHRRWGRWYRRALGPAVLSAAALVAVRPAADWPLLVLGAVAVVAAVLGRSTGPRRRAVGRRTRHATAMAVSCSALLTAFYVDNGPHLPLWNRLPVLAFWLGPTLIATLLLARPCRPSGVRPRGGSGVGGELVGGVGGGFELEGAVLDVEVVGQALGEPVEQASGAPVLGAPTSSATSVVLVIPRTVRSRPGSVPRRPWAWRARRR